MLFSSEIQQVYKGKNIHLLAATNILVLNLVLLNDIKDRFQFLGSNGTVRSQFKKDKSTLFIMLVALYNHIYRSPTWTLKWSA